MPGTYERCGAKQTLNGWHTCNRKAGHKGDHSDTKMSPATYWKQEVHQSPLHSGGNYADTGGMARATAPRHYVEYSADHEPHARAAWEADLP